MSGTDTLGRCSSFRVSAVLHDGILLWQRLHQLVSTNHCRIKAVVLTYNGRYNARICT